MVRWIGIGLVLIGIAAVGYYAFTPHGQSVEAAEVRKGTIRTYVEELGKTRLPRVYRISMPLDGRVEPIELEAGTEVKAGEVVARLDPSDLESELAAAQARVGALDAMIAQNDDTRLEQTALDEMKHVLISLDRTVEAAAEEVKASEARHAYDVTQLKRQQSLAESGAAATMELDSATLAEVESRVTYQQDILIQRAIEAIRAAAGFGTKGIQQYTDKKSLQRNVYEKQKEEAEASVERIRRDVARGEMKSQVDGVVLKRHVSNERFLPAGSMLMEIGRLEDLQVEADILTQQAVAIQPGQAVDVLGVLEDDAALRGTVMRVEPEGFTKVSSLGVEQQRVLVIVGFDAETMDALREKKRQLGVEYRVTVRIYTAEHEDAMIVPRSSLFRGVKGGWQVFVVRDGKAVLTDVKVGLLNDIEAEIVSPLEAGDRVVVAPQSDLEDGGGVTISTREGG